MILYDTITNLYVNYLKNMRRKAVIIYFCITKTFNLDILSTYTFYVLEN